MFLAPLTDALTTMKHCQFGHLVSCSYKQCRRTSQERDGDSVSRGAGTPLEAVERVTRNRKLRTRRKWQVPALPPGRPSKNDCSNSFGQLRHLPPPGVRLIFLREYPRQLQKTRRVTRRTRNSLSGRSIRGLTKWTLWIIGACLTGGALLIFLRNT